eukprot:TRINITY_DN103697_c0_g1_i1.p1 TRINITY_DN103697_c0_g1~~TRINITY_DN103697_c0_g1_i1.p1  ORF type:complete len:186 (-),score=28.04 TRINITY_DN103697_c0_g1_i1:203-760(-)
MLTAFSGVAAQLPRALLGPLAVGSKGTLLLAPILQRGSDAAFAPEIILPHLVPPGAVVVPQRCPISREEGATDLPASSISEAPVEAPPLSHGSSQSSRSIECRYSNRRRKSQGLEERWWLEFDPAKANYKSGFGRGPFGGNSIPKKDWPRQMFPINYKQNWEKRERLRFAFRKHGYEYDVPKLGG